MACTIPSCCDSKSSTANANCERTRRELTLAVDDMPMLDDAPMGMRLIPASLAARAAICQRKMAFPPIRQARKAGCHHAFSAAPPFLCRYRTSARSTASRCAGVSRAWAKSL